MSRRRVHDYRAIQTRVAGTTVSAAARDLGLCRKTVQRILKGDPDAKIIDQDAIREAVKRMSVTATAREFGISRRSVQRILNGDQRKASVRRQTPPDVSSDVLMAQQYAGFLRALQEHHPEKRVAL